MIEPGHIAQSRGQFLVVGEDCDIGDGVTIGNLVYIGKRVKIGCDVMVGSLVHLSDDCVIGNGSQIGGSTFLSPASVIGERCVIGPGATLTNDRFPPVRRKTGIAAWAGVVLEDEAVLGAGAAVLSGVTIGRGSVVGIGSVVLENVPPEMVVSGSPAKVICSRAEYERRVLERGGSERISPGDLTLLTL